MRSKLLRITALLAAFLVNVSAFAQDLGESASVQWSVTQEKTGEDLYRITFTGRIMVACPAPVSQVFCSP